VQRPPGRPTKRIAPRPRVDHHFPTGPIPSSPSRKAGSISSHARGRPQNPASERPPSRGDWSGRCDVLEEVGGVVGHGRFPSFRSHSQLSPVLLQDMLPVVGPGVHRRGHQARDLSTSGWIALVPPLRYLRYRPINSATVMRCTRGYCLAKSRSSFGRRTVSFGLRPYG